MTAAARNPYLIEGPALISFSGGRSSGYMLKQILDAHGGSLPDDVKVVFANTGKEMPETLDFVQECSERWGVPIVWLEHAFDADDKHSFRQVDYHSASRNGEPFKQLIDSRGFLPNPVTRYCTVELKIRTMARFGRSLGWDEFDKVVGLRADEPRRVAKMEARSAEKSPSREKGERDVLMPMAKAGVIARHITAFWRVQPFDLRLENINDNTPGGNCDFCFLKAFQTIYGLTRKNPEGPRWWAEAEAEARASKPEGARFRNDRPGYAEIMKMVRDQGDFFGDYGDTMPCDCHD